MPSLFRPLSINRKARSILMPKKCMIYLFLKLLYLFCPRLLSATSSTHAHPSSLADFKEDGLRVAEN